MMAHKAHNVIQLVTNTSAIISCNRLFVLKWIASMSRKRWINDLIVGSPKAHHMNETSYLPNEPSMMRSFVRLQLFMELKRRLSDGDKMIQCAGDD